MSSVRVPARMFVVEAFLPTAEQGGAPELIGKLRSAAAGLRSRGGAIRFEQVLLLPSDELLIVLIRARDLEGVVGAFAAAGVQFDRISVCRRLVVPRRGCRASGSRPTPELIAPS